MKNLNHIKRHAVSLLAGLVLGCAFALPAAAEDAPFQLDGSHWMSFDHYKDADKRGIIERPALPTADAAPGAAPAIAAPTRPIALPVMPGVNKGFDMQVTSTEDAHQAELVTAAPNSPGQSSDLRLADKNWQAPATIHTAQKDEDGNDSDAPLNVRMSYLPDTHVTPAPSPDHASAQQLGHVALQKILQARLAKQQGDKDKPRTPAEAAACAAIDAYQKQQLTAIQSDRQTLKELQAAIHSLGLEKQLNFMAGANGAVGAEAARMDMPVSSAVR